MKAGRWFSAASLALGALLAMCLAAGAAPPQRGPKTGIDLGPLHIEPDISLVGIYSTNYFLEAADRKSEWTASLGPRLTLSLGKDQRKVELHYEGEYLRNDRYSRYNVNHHIARLMGQWMGDTGPQAELGMELRHQSNPPNFLGDERKEYDDLNPSLRAGWRFLDRYGLMLGFAHTKRRFDDERFNRDDHDQSEVTGDLSWRALPKTTLFLEAGWKQTQYPERTNENYDNLEKRLWLGARTKPSALIRGEVKGGYLAKDWQSQAVGEDYATIGLKADLSYSPSKRTELALSLFRDIQDTSFSTSQSPEFGASYDRTGGTLSLTVIPRKRITLRFYGGFENDAYNPPPEQTGVVRNDDKVTAGFSLDWEVFKASHLGFAYDYTDNDSNANESDYVEHLFQFYLSLGI